ncbi:MAG: hypothetical protein KJ876_07610, partial [Alphaproteobacteria bacterium]|nr:hypothetical protein [Alphaproteobacteria bacterium]
PPGGPGNRTSRTFIPFAVIVWRASLGRLPDAEPVPVAAQREAGQHRANRYRLCAFVRLHFYDSMKKKS